MAYSKIILNGETLMDVTSDTVVAGAMTSGTTATKNDGTKVTGTIVTKSAADLTASGSTVTVPGGYYSAQATKNVASTTHPNPTAAITSSTGVVTATHTQTAGYVAAGTTTGTLQLTSKAAATYNTSTADQTVASYRWLTGTQTIKSVTTSNLTAANIASGVVVKVGDANNASRITQVTGTYAPAVSSVTITPTETTQTFNATGVYGYKPVTINGISSTYVGTGIARKSSTDTTFTSTNGTFTAPIGYYSAAATKTLTTQAAQTIYPSTADRTISSYRWLTGAQTIKSVTTSNLTAANIAEGVVVKVGDANNASRITQITGTHSGSKKYTATISSYDGRYGSGNSTRCYVLYNNIKYYTLGDSFTYNEGDILTIYNTDTEIWIDGNGNVESTSYSYTLPSNGVDIFIYNDGEYCGIDVRAKLSSDMIYFNEYWDDINETYYYTCNKTYSELYSLNRELMAYIESPFNYRFVYTGIIIGSGTFANTIRFRNYAGVMGDVARAQILYYSDGTIEYTHYPYKIVAEINITSNGTYSSESTYYKTINVSVTGSGYTVDEIAMRTISGDISGSASFVSDHAFKNCNSITTATFPSCTSIGTSAFYSCSYLTNISFPICTLISFSAFAYCDKLVVADFPSCSSIGTSAFTTCRSLTTANFPVCKSIASYAFNSCYKLSNISFPICSFIGSYAFRSCYFSSIEFPSCTTISAYAFTNCSSLRTISFPMCTSIYVGAFGGCSKLTSASFSLLSIISSSVFSCCSLLSIVNFSICTSIGAYAFYSCTSLMTISFPSCTIIGSYAFASCVYLRTNVNFPNCTIISAGAFQSCTSLNTLSFSKVTSIESNAFNQCTRLCSFYLNGVSSVPTLGNYAFSSTPIGGYSAVAGQYGSIFVPSSLYNSFRTATNWATYSARMVSV